MGRSGGWPLTVFLTPEQRPFYAGTYFPTAGRHGLPGFPKRGRERLAEAYQEQRRTWRQQAQELGQATRPVYGSHRRAR
jgi:uncharacterized protein YyaL (SSP411 family)